MGVKFIYDTELFIVKKSVSNLFSLFQNMNKWFLLLENCIFLNFNGHVS